MSLANTGLMVAFGRRVFFVIRYRPLVKTLTITVILGNCAERAKGKKESVVLLAMDRGRHLQNEGSEGGRLYCFWKEEHGETNAVSD